MEPPTQTRRRMKGILRGLAAALIWGGFQMMTRLGGAHSSLDMLDAAFPRFAVSCLLLPPLLIRSGRRPNARRLLRSSHGPACRKWSGGHLSGRDCSWHPLYKIPYQSMRWMVVNHLRGHREASPA